MDFWKLFLVLLVLVIAGLIAYALYVRARITTSKGRFATSIVFAIVAIPPATIIAVSQSHFTDSLVAVLSSLGGGDIEVTSASVLGQVIDATLVATISVVSFVCLYLFGSRAVQNWDTATPTEVDARLFLSNTPPTLIPVALSYLQLKLEGKSDLPIDPESIRLTSTLDEPPKGQSWRDISRQLLLDTQNEIALPQDGWSDTLKCWVGQLTPRHTGTTKQLLLVPTASLEAKSANYIASQILLAQPSKDAIIIICPDIDAVIDRDAPEYGHNFRILSRAAIIEQSLDLESYCHDILRRYSASPVLGSSLTLSDIYVPAIANDGTNARPISQILGAWLKVNQREHVSLIGDFGQGKSTAILHYCAQWAERRLRGEAADERVPLLIPLRGRDPAGLPPSQFLAAWGDQYGLPGKALLNMILAGRAVLIFEGFDEVNSAGTKDERLRQFNAIWKFAFPRSKMILTGRPNFFVNSDEEARLLRIDARGAQEGRVVSKAVTLEYFSATQAREALRSFPQSVSESILLRFRTHADFRSIASRPSMLPLIAIIWPEIQASIEKGESITTASVIERYVQFEYRRKSTEIEDDESRHKFSRSQNYIRIPERIKDFFLVAVARHMAESDQENTISGTQFNEIVKTSSGFAEAYFGGVALPEETSYFSKLRELSSDIRTLGEIKERLASELRATGLLVRDTTKGSDSLCFPHMQFYEYYLARSSVMSMNRKHSGDRRNAEVDKFLAVNEPCRAISESRQAQKFFVQMSTSEWYESVFTTNFNLLNKLSVVAYLSFSVLILFGAHRIMKAGPAEKLISILIAFLITISSIAVVAGVLFAFSSFSFALIATGAAVGLALVVLAIGGKRSLGKIELWVALVRQRLPKVSAQHCKRILGPFTTWLLHTFEVRRADAVIQNALWMRQLREELTGPTSRSSSPGSL